MEKGKLIPIIVAVVLGLVVIYLIASKGIFNKVESFSHFSYTYNNETTNKDDITVSDIFVINNVSFSVSGIEGNKIILNASESFNDSDNTEIVVELNNEKEVCFKENDCITFSLS